MSDDAGPTPGAAEVAAEVRGHAEALAYLRRAEGHAFAFVGPPRIGRRTAALWWARWATCDAVRFEGADAPCGRCESCRLHAAGHHPDVVVKAPAAETKGGRAALTPMLRIDQLVRRDGPSADPDPLAPRVRARPRYGTSVAILDGAETLNEAAGNAFLKLLEEPPSWARIVLIAPSVGALLPTLASRCTPVRFAAPPVDGYADAAPHPALRTGQLGWLRSDAADPERTRGLRDAADALAAALPGPLDAALEAGRAWARAKREIAPDEADAWLLEAVRRTAPAAYPAALTAVREADEAARAYVGTDVVAATLVLRLRAAVA